MTGRPEALVFDVLDTLFPLGPLEWRFREAGIPRVLIARWCDHLMRDAFALALLGEEHGFEDVARGSLRAITGHQIAPAAEDAIVAGLTRLEPRREAAEALSLARDAGVRTVVASPLDEAGTRSLLEHAGLDVEVPPTTGTRVWRPSPWGGRGRAAGLVTGWSSHLEGRFPELFGEPHVRGHDLVTTVEALLVYFSQEGS
ncbi:HAD family hydrolase [Nocardiopsis alba]|uniref:Haloacid dehalogenase-like hydrolase family protein n=1 Tax=Nocardiopsis alba (strain ATCC BAA-2165 / BE74) TaxID=1205910 RepID=J7LI37_NOCAA|nr:haloacid dehalogenase [Nocardiopsis alba]AFR10327.1 haloacid dehalogenase-like hydrolase family protein [Nocardiopsis alba ATCC BAA-2165]